MALSIVSSRVSEFIRRVGTVCTIETRSVELIPFIGVETAGCA